MQKGTTPFVAALLDLMPKWDYSDKQFRVDCFFILLSFSACIYLLFLSRKTNLSSRSAILMMPDVEGQCIPISIPCVFSYRFRSAQRSPFFSNKAIGLRTWVGGYGFSRTSSSTTMLPNPGSSSGGLVCVWVTSLTMRRSGRFLVPRIHPIPKRFNRSCIQLKRNHSKDMIRQGGHRKGAQPRG